MAKEKDKQDKKVCLGWYAFKGHIAHLFTPMIVIAVEAITVLLIDLICIAAMCGVERGTVAYDVAFAIMTGLTASGVLAVATEMSNNYRRNAIRLLTLSGLFSFLVHYEMSVAMETKDFDYQRMHKDFMKQIYGENWEPADNVSENPPSQPHVVAVLEKLPEMIPLVKDAYQNHCTELKKAEVFLLKSILYEHKEICFLFKLVLEGYVNFYTAEDNDQGELVQAFGERMAQELMTCARMDIDDPQKEERILQCVEKLLWRGAWKTIGLPLSDEAALVNDEQLEETLQEQSDAEKLGNMIARGLHIIDEDIISLSKMVTKEPGHNAIYRFSKEKVEKYRREKKSGNNE